MPLSSKSYLQIQVDDCSSRILLDDKRQVRHFLAVIWQVKQLESQLKQTELFSPSS